MAGRAVYSSQLKFNSLQYDSKYQIILFLSLKAAKPQHLLRPRHQQGQKCVLMLLQTQPLTGMRSNGQLDAVTDHADHVPVSLRMVLLMAVTKRIPKNAAYHKTKRHS